jgi:hypothetical protein
MPIIRLKRTGTRTTIEIRVGHQFITISRQIALEGGPSPLLNFLEFKFS